MAKQDKSGGEQSSPPASYPNTPPPTVGTDISTWLLNASTRMEGTLGKMEATIAGIQTQLSRIEIKLGEVEKEVTGIGKWMHTLKAFAAVVLLLLGWIFVNAVWPWLKAKIGVPPG